MQSLAYIKGSDGAANASLMTVTNVRTPGATTILTNTVANAPTYFYGSMGTPHTFTDPVTGETITVISDATAVDFAGRIDSGHVEIVAIAPGYTDLGSQVGDIVVIRPVTEWANNIFNVLDEVHEDDGSLKDGVVDTNAIQDSAVTSSKIASSTITGSDIASGTITSSNIDFTTSGNIWWQELGRQTLSVGATNITVSFTAKRHLQVFVYVPSMPQATSVLGMIFNNDTTTNYNLSMFSAGSYSSPTNQVNIAFDAAANQFGRYAALNITNLQSNIKLGSFLHTQLTGTTAASAMTSRTAYFGWYNTSAQISSIKINDLVNPAQNLPAGSYVVVLGHD